MNTLEGAEQPQKWQQRRFVPGPEQQNQRELSLLIDKEYLFKYGGNPVGHNPSAQLIQDAPLQTQKSPQSLYSGQPQQSTAAPIKQAQQPQSSQGQKRHWPHLGRRVPVQLQMSQVECGAACVAMMLSYHGRQCSIAEINEQAGIGRDGLSALDITRMARKYGLRVRAITTEDADLRGVTLPAIVHWQFNHFLIVERWTTHYVDVVDPARGRRRISSREFDQSFTGVVIMLEPGEHFERRRHHSNITIASYARQYIQRAPWIFVQIILASLLIQVLGLAIPLLTASVIDKVIPQKSYGLLPILGLGMAVVIIAQLVTTQLRALLLIYLQIRIDRHMLPAFMEHLLSLPQSFFLKRTSGDIMTRINSNTTIRDIVSSQLVSTILDGGTVLIYLVILLTRGTGFGMIVLGIGSMQIVLLLLSSRKLRMLSRRELEATGKTQGYVGEILKGMEALKVGGAEQRVLDRWSNVFSEQLNASVQRNYVASTVKTLMGTLQMLSTMLLLWYGTGQVMQGHLLLGTMLSLNILASAFLTPLASLVSSSQQLQIVRSHLERIADVLEARPEQDVQQVHQPPRLKGSIRLDNVSFRYDTNSPMILKHISLEIEPGQKIAIVGRTGSGKSTLGKLLLGLMQATKGEISYDGIPLRYLNYQAVRAQFGVVMQDVGIFSGSIRQNIAFNAPDIPVETIVNVARLAELNNDIAHMPMGYETFVSEGGNALSGGQRQRLAIARALAHRPALLLMDEATSALDVLTEHRIEENLRRLPCTQILIAHRLSTIRNADRILVLDDGVLVEQGTHAELLRRNSFYAHLIQYQLASGEVRSE